MWKKTLVRPEMSIQEVLAVIDDSALQIALVVNEKGQLLGTVTDGDIRRALLKHIDLTEPVAGIMNPHPRYITCTQSREDALQLMKSHKLNQIPILNQDYCVVGMEVAQDLFTPPLHNNLVILMAGGLGQRLKPLTENCPKPLLKVGGKVLLETILENFISEGFNNFYFSVNYRAQMIMDYFGDGSRWGISIQYLQENKRLGTAGALSLLPVKPLEPLIVMNADILTKINMAKLLEFHKQNQGIATICVKEHHKQIPYGVVAFKENHLQYIEEKPMQRFFINAGIYVLNPEVLEYVPPQLFFDIPDLIKKLLQAEKAISVFPIREYWIDIGRLDEYERANHEFNEVFA
jgi:dTDP-glucose pyrophosphorylase